MPPTPDYQTPDHQTLEPKHDPYAPWRISAYRIFACSFALAVIGSQIFATAVQWQVYKLTNDPLNIGYLGAIQLLPVLCFGLIAGHIADRFSRKKILLLMQIAVSIFPASLAWIIFSHPNWEHTLLATYGIVLLNAIALSFGRPARSSILPTLVPTGMFGLAATWNSSLFEVAAITGPAIAGLIIGGFSVAAALWVSSVCTVVTVLLTCFLPNLKLKTPAEPMSVNSLLAGVRFVYRVKLLLAMMTLDLVAVLFAGVTALLPFFAERLGTNAAGFGFLRAAPSIGAVTTALILTHLPPMRHAGRMLIMAFVGYGIATIIFGISTSYWLSIAMLAMTGAFDNINVVIRHTLVQTLTPDAMRGRVSAVNQIFIASSNELGMLESGIAAKLLGPVTAVVVGGIGAIATVFHVAVRYPDVRRVKTLEGVREAARDVEEIDPIETVVAASEVPDVPAHNQQR